MGRATRISQTTPNRWEGRPTRSRRAAPPPPSTMPGKNCCAGTALRTMIGVGLSGFVASCVMKVIIAGGGIGGLTTALMLHARGIDCEIYEQSETIRELGVGINTLPHAIKELAEL